jgi:hypothetical protein
MFKLLASGTNVFRERFKTKESRMDPQVESETFAIRPGWTVPCLAT